MNPFDNPSNENPGHKKPGHHDLGHHDLGHHDLGHHDLGHHDLGHHDTRFDRLVDGELSPVERRQLLASLDAEPGGWRRCALAFLEDQAWRESLSEFRQRTGAWGPGERRGESAGRTDQTGLPAVDTAQPGLERKSIVGLALAMAACFLVAFFLGTEFRQRLFSGTTPPAPLARQQTPQTLDDPNQDPSDETPRTIAVQTPPNLVRPWGEATFVMDGDEGRELEVPVFDLDPDARQLLLESSTAALDDLRHQLQRRGYDVQRIVRWSPVEMGGGQQILVPIGEFEVSPISTRPVQ